MILHIHSIDVDGTDTPIYVLHAHPSEARMLADAIHAALGRSPDSESYNITLGRVEDLDAVHQDELERIAGEVPEESTFNGNRIYPTESLILPGSGLATP